MIGYIPDGLYESFLGGEWVTFFGELYVSFLPILAALPFGSSLFEDSRNGYAKHVISRAGKWNYLCSKGIVTVIAGGIAGVFPYLLSLFLCSLIYPAYYPHALTMRSFVQEITIFSDLYYLHPFLYVWIYAVLIFFISGLLAGLSLLAAEKAKNVLVVLFVPYIVYSLQDVIFEKLEWQKWAFKIIVFPARNAGTLSNMSAWNLILLIGCSYLLLGGIFVWRTKKRNWMTW